MNFLGKMAELDVVFLFHRCWHDGTIRRDDGTGRILIGTAPDQLVLQCHSEERQCMEAVQIGTESQHGNILSPRF